MTSTLVDQRVHATAALDRALDGRRAGG